jgi:hypothetical protein
MFLNKFVTEVEHDGRGIVRERGYKVKSRRGWDIGYRIWDIGWDC